ncbi:hypothetical protein SAMN05444365_10113 [Micromonospora pattaloongensis]|uniref:Uncharacterized protein n=1 Tax=Micromonospora pattaloongensis TaxID=405436 RepID=A0A1H3FHK4_9ACTN|nr:DUF6232 family protein [Micromonospora pattaloongensis]SDX90456.1 hypothetical protein SAMN05444365_10113 [Micromonospora pattaloongensis]
MITYYDDRFVQVTSAAIRVGGRSYPLAELAGVWHRRGERSWGALAGRGAVGVALIAPIVAAAIGIAVALSLHASISTTVALVGGACLVGLAVGPLADLLLDRMDRSYDRGTRDLQLWAEVRGAPVLVLQTRDALKFGQIYRALQRAMERRALAHR